MRKVISHRTRPASRFVSALTVAAMAVAMGAGSSLLRATPAFADPVVHATAATTVTFSDDTLDPGQAFTVTVDYNYHFTNGTSTQASAVTAAEIKTNGVKP